MGPYSVFSKGTTGEASVTKSVISKLRVLVFWSSIMFESYDNSWSREHRYRISDGNSNMSESVKLT